MSALAAYDLALGGRPLRARRSDGGGFPVPLARWLGQATAGDRTVLERAVAPVLDVGCGPGRLVGALARDGVTALGIDVSAAAVRRTRARRAPALQLDVFGPVPGCGGWGTVVLLDGNIGIGGDPARLLARCAELAGSGGRILVETGPPGEATGPFELELAVGGVGGSLSWATVSADGIGGVAMNSGLSVQERWRHGGRWFASLARA